MCKIGQRGWVLPCSAETVANESISSHVYRSSWRVIFNIVVIQGRHSALNGAYLRERSELASVVLITQHLDVLGFSRDDANAFSTRQRIASR